MERVGGHRVDILIAFGNFFLFGETLCFELSLLVSFDHHHHISFELSMSGWSSHKADNKSG